MSEIPYRYIYIQLYNKKREMMVTLFHSFFIFVFFVCVCGGITLCNNLFVIACVRMNSV